MRQAQRQARLLRVTALSAALMGVYGTSYAVDVTAGAGETKEITTGTAYTSATAQDGGVINGVDAAIDGVRSTGTVRAESGGQISLSGGSVKSDSTGLNTSASAVRADGHTSRVELTDVEVTQIGAHNHGSPRAGVETRQGGTVVITGGSITSTNDALLATGDGDLVGGGSITATNVNINVTGSRAEGIHVYGYNGSTGEGVPHTGEVPEEETVINLVDSTLTTTGDDIWSVYANFSKAVVNVEDSDVITSGAKSQAVTAGKFGKVNVTGGKVQSTGTDTFTVQTYEWGAEISLDGTRVESLASTNNAGGLLAQGTNSLIKAVDTEILVSGGNGIGAKAIEGNRIELTRSTVETAGGNGLHASGSGSTITALDTTTVTTEGKYGLRVDNGAQTTVTGGSIINESTSPGRIGIGADGTGTQVTTDGTVIRTHGEFTSAGELSSAVEAKNGAHVDLVGGSAEYLGNQYGRGILAMTGAQVTTDGTDILTTGTNSHAVHANVETKDAGSVVVPRITLTGGTVRAEGDMSWGLYAQNGGQIVSSADITTIGAGGFGVFSDNQLGGGETRIELKSGSVTTEGGANTFGHGSHGVISKYSGSTVDIDGSTIRVKHDHESGKSAAALLTELGGHIHAKNATIETDGTWAFGANATGGGTIDIDGGSIKTNNAKGKGTQDGDGSRAYAIYAKDANSSIETNGTEIVTQGQRAYGAYATDTGNVELTGGSITTHGFMAYGVYASGAGSTVTTNDVDITTNGQVGDAIWAYQGGVTTINGGNILVHGDPNPNSPHESGNGIVAAGGTAGAGNGVVNVNNASITTMGRDSVGALAGALIGATSTSGTINLNNTQLEVQGAGAVGASVENGSTLTASNGTRIASLQGNGIDFVNSGTATLTGTTVAAAGDAFHSTFTTAGQTQNITLGANSTVSSGNGNLLYVQRKTDGSNGAVNLTLLNGSHASGNIRNYDAEGNLVTHVGSGTTVDVQDGAIWAGIFIDPGTSVVDGDEDMDDFTTGEGEDVAIDGTGGGTQNFNGNTNIGGSVSVGRDVSFNGPTTIGNDLNGQDGTSTSIQGPATIGGSVVGGAGSSFAFNNTTSIGGGVAGADGSHFSFNGDTNIIGGVMGQGGASFSFSQTGSSSIGGDVNLGGGSSLGGGSMNNPINVGGNAVVGAGSTLGGNLNVAGSLSGSGGTFAPGNSIGSQTYGSMGSFTGTYVAEVNSAGLSDLVTIASGNADLTGIDLKVSQENGNGGYKLYHDYTIVKTGKADGISAVAGNKFASEALDDTFAGTLVKLDPAKFGANDVKISLSVDGDAIDRTGLSSNQSATLDGALSVAGQNASADALMFMQPDARKDALNQLSGELHGSTQAALLQTSSLVSRTLSARMRGNLGAGMQPGAPTAQAGGAVAGSMPTSTAYPLWAQVVGNWNTLDSDGNAAKVKTNTAGLFIGGDTGVGAGWRVGGALGYTDGRVKVDDRDSRSDVGTFTAALYGGNSWDQGNGKVNFLAGAAYSHHSIDTRRSVNVGGNQTLKADYSAHTTQLFTELGYAMPVGERSVVEPYVGLAWLSQKARGFTEEGGAAALSADSQKDDVTTFTLGLRGKTALNVGSNPAHLFAGLGWRHASGDVDPGRSMSFVQGGGAAFNVAGAPIAKNAAVFDLGVEMSVGRNTAMGLGYSGQYGSDNTDHSGQLYLRTRF